jgi:hypothetical protein
VSASFQWRKSSFSGAEGENCVEIAEHAGAIVMRESDDPHLILSTTRGSLAAFIAGVKAGEFDHLVK